VRTLEQFAIEACLELGPRGVLSSMAATCAPELGACIPALRRSQPEFETVTQALTELHVRGFEIDWASHFAQAQPRVVGLPTYPFQRRRYWLEPSTARTADSLRYHVTWESVPEGRVATAGPWLLVCTK